MIRKFVFFACLIWPTLCCAGGDAVSGRVTGFTAKEGKYIIRFLQTENAPDLISGCKEIEVSVKFARVPWFSWLPFVASNHPSKKETDEAIEYMRNANHSNQLINFGYMGYGLVPTEKNCSFKSKGLRIYRDQGKTSVLSFHDQTGNSRDLSWIVLAICIKHYCCRAPHIMGIL
ncbi:MAG: hypothetical protein HGA46_11540, partial [Chlorobiaceae bacterium]|nr:hypothetical protein [Chlorobiaceae bacterium]